MKNKKTLKLVYSALFSALIFCGSQFIQIPLPFGYFNLGDCFIILSAVFIGGPYCVISSAIGSVMADVLSGYTVYVPATLLIKSAMAAVITVIYNIKKVKKEISPALLLTAGIILSESIMVCGYFIYDFILYSLAGAAASLPGNIIQALCSITASSLIITAFNRIRGIKL